MWCGQGRRADLSATGVTALRSEPSWALKQGSGCEHIRTTCLTMVPKDKHESHFPDQVTGAPTHGRAVPYTWACLCGPPVAEVALVHVKVRTWGRGCLLEMGSLAVLTLASRGNKLLSDPGHLSLPAPRCVMWDGPTAEPSILSPAHASLVWRCWVLGQGGTPLPFGAVSRLPGLLSVLGLLDPS